MVDMQLLNSTLVALAVVTGVAIALSAAIVAVAAIVRRGYARTGGSQRGLLQHPVAGTRDTRRLVLR
jgi:hypothetical protein